MDSNKPAIGHTSTIITQNLATEQASNQNFKNQNLTVNNQNQGQSNLKSFKSPTIPRDSSIPERKRKGPVPKLYGDEICLICDDKATGFHYGALSCEACKGFFRRTKLKKIIDYRCKFQKNCNIAIQRVDKSVKRICQYCRYTKCVTLGMKDNVRQGEVIQDLQRFMQSNPGYAPSKHVLKSKDIDDVIANVKKESDSRFEIARIQQENDRISRESSNVGSPGFEFTNSDRTRSSSPVSLSMNHKPEANRVPGIPEAPSNTNSPFTCSSSYPCTPINSNSHSDSPKTATNHPNSYPNSNSGRRNPNSVGHHQQQYPRSPHPKSPNTQNDNYHQKNLLNSPNHINYSISVNNMIFPLHPPKISNGAAIYNNVQETEEHLTELEISSHKFLIKAHPKVAEVALCTSWRGGNSLEDQQARIQHFTDKGIINAKITTRQVQIADEFHELEKADQLIILKQSMVEVIYLRLAQNYNHSDQTMTCIKDGSRYPKSYFTLVGHDIKYADAVWKFCHQMNYLLKDKEIITCLFFITVFNSSRDNLSERAIGILDKARTKYLLYLKIHCKRKYIETQPLLYCHLLMKLADTSNLMDMNLEQIKKSERVLERFPFQPDACGKHLREQKKNLADPKHTDKQVDVADFRDMSAPVSYMKDD